MLLERHVHRAKLGTILLYAREMARVLRKGGHAIVDYIDVSVEEGWEYLLAQSAVHHRTYTYHRADTIDRVFSLAGLTAVRRHQYGKSAYVVFRKE